MIAEFNEHRQLLFGIAYRMLGRVTEAEDMVQETWLRWQRQTPEKVQSARAWLIATITRLSIDQLRSAKRHREDYYGVWLPEPLVEASPTRPPDEAAKLADSLSMAFMLLLENLSPAERAVFILREVFDYEYAEISRLVAKSEENCRKMVSRAKAQLKLADAYREDAERAASNKARGVVESFLTATKTGEISELLELLTDDAILHSDGGGVVTAAGRPIVTAERVSRFFVGIRRRMTSSVEMQLAVINQRWGALVYIEGRLDRTYTFDVVNGRIRTIYLVRNPEKLSHLRAFALERDRESTGIGSQGRQ